MADKGKNTIVTLDYGAAKKAGGILRALNNHQRHKILKVVSDNERIRVTDIYIKLRAEQSVTSQQLAILRESNILTAETEGRLVYYLLNKKRIGEIASLVGEFVTKE